MHEVTLRRGADGIVATWAGDYGRDLVNGAAVVISREHPNIDKLRTCTVAHKSRSRLVLRPGIPDVDIENGTWRLDVEVNYVPYYRVASAIQSFTSLPPGPPPSDLQVLLGSYYGQPQQRRAINKAAWRPRAANMEALAGLNDDQSNAIQRSLAQRVLPIQGPLGTGKTQVAEAIIRLWKSNGVQGPSPHLP